MAAPRLDPSHAAAPHPRRWWALAVLCLSVLIVLVDNTIVNVALPTLSRELRASTSDLQWLVDAYTLLFAGLMLTGGGLGDRFGRKPVLQVGLVLFAATSVWAAYASTTGELIAARAAMGVSAALIYPATLAILSTIFTDRREKATAIGIWTAVSGLAVAVGPVSGGVLLKHFSWSSIFLVNIPLVVLALVAGKLLLPSSRDPHPGRFDAVGAVLSVASVGLLVWTVIEAPDHGWLSPATLGGFVGAALLSVVFTWWELRRSQPLLDVRVFANRRVSAASAAVAMAYFGLFGFIFMITQYFQAVRGYDTLRAGVATLPFAVVVGLLSPVAIVLMKRWGTTVVVAAGLLLMSSGFLLVTVTTVDAPYWGPIVVAMVLMAAGLGLTTGPATDAIMGALPAVRVGAGSAINDTTREVGGALGVAVIGSVLSSVYGGKLATELGGLGLPADAVSAARHSVIAAFEVVGQLPGELQGPAVATVRTTFMDGLHAGSLASAIATALAAVGVLVALPKHDRHPDGHAKDAEEGPTEQTATDAAAQGTRQPATPPS
ncbi:MFS transporter [Rhodococcus sp. X156]|uniref:MFS transporter n=1 Tax=Rhodococcus sp. X156 TaxID=2499145 RepID=UPI000FD8FE3E|nr:MFS transporter [Rhodococcus sp. X156]